MGKITFGQKKTVAEKAEMATKRGYDTGKASAGANGASKWKAKPTASKGKVGVEVKKKF